MKWIKNEIKEAVSPTEFVGEPKPTSDKTVLQLMLEGVVGVYVKDQADVEYD